VFGLELPEMEPEGDYEVLPEAWPAVDMFLRVQTQWRVSGGALIGLDYSAVRWMFEIQRVEDQADLLSDLQIIEATVIEAMHRQRKD
jgi:hypothetical protein